MALNHPKSGPQWTNAFLLPGIPWVTGSVSVSDSVKKIEFPSVTKEFSVSNTGGSALRVGFTQNGVTGTFYYSVASGEEKVFNLRVRDVYISGSTTFDIVAGLTTISRNDFPNITGSNPAPTGSQYVPNIG